MKFDLDIYNHKGMSDYSILPSEENRNYIYVLSNNQTLASEVYNEIITSYNLNKHFTTDDFNEVIDHLSGDCRAEFKNQIFCSLYLMQEVVLLHKLARQELFKFAPTTRKSCSTRATWFWTSTIPKQGLAS